MFCREKRIQPELINIKMPIPSVFNSSRRSASPASVSSHRTSRYNTISTKKPESFAIQSTSRSAAPSVASSAASSSVESSLWKNMLVSLTPLPRPRLHTPVSPALIAHRQQQQRAVSPFEMFKATHNSLLRNHLIKMQAQNEEKYRAKRPEQLRK